MLEVSCDGIFSPVFTPIHAQCSARLISLMMKARDLMSHCADLGFCCTVRRGGARGGELTVGGADQGLGIKKYSLVCLHLIQKGKDKNFIWFFKKLEK